MRPRAPKFLADEGCDFAVVRALRQAGFDVLAVCEIMTRSNDSNIIRLSNSENRILLTEDKDFGWLVFVSHTNSAGVILMRYPANARSTFPPAVPRAWESARLPLIPGRGGKPVQTEVQIATPVLP